MKSHLALEIVRASSAEVAVVIRGRWRKLLVTVIPIEVIDTGETNPAGEPIITVNFAQAVAFADEPTLGLVKN